MDSFRLASDPATRVPDGEWQAGRVLTRKTDNHQADYWGRRRKLKCSTDDLEQRHGLEAFPSESKVPMRLIFFTGTPR